MGNRQYGIDPDRLQEYALEIKEIIAKGVQVAIEIVTKAALQPKSVADENYDFEDQLRDEGFSEREIDELMAQAYFASMMNTFIDSFDIPWETPFPPETG